MPTTTPDVAAADAARKALSTSDVVAPQFKGQPELVIFLGEPTAGESTTPTLAWRTNVQPTERQRLHPGAEHVYTDAHTNHIIARREIGRF